MKNIYKVSKFDWMWHLSDKQKKKVIKQAEACLDDPLACPRDKNKAAHNLIMINKQNMDACDNNQSPDTTINITIKEEEKK